MKKLALVLAATLSVAACGSTVQIRGTVASGLTAAEGGTDGLGAPATGTPGDSGGTTPVGATVGATRGTTPGQRGTSGRTPSAGAPSTNGGAIATTRSPSTDRSPLTVGMLVTTASGLDSTGYSLGNTVNEQRVDEALVRAFNAQGGLAGHKLIGVYAKTDTFSSSWESDFSAACETFTNDNKVKAVLGYSFNYYASFESCLAKKGIPHLSSSFNIPNRKELSRFPAFVAVDVPTVERRGLAKVDGALATGYLTAKNKLGIMADNCPGSQDSLNDVVLPFIKRAGLPAPKVQILSCVNGYADSGNSGAQLSNAELAFASAGIDRVMIHGVSEGPSMAQFTSVAESQGYRPGYIVSSLGNLALNNGTIQPAQARNIHGFGWLPMEDVAVADYGPLNSAQARCVKMLKSQDITLSATADYVFAFQICEPMFVYEAALLLNGNHADAASVTTAIRQLGTSVTSVTNLGGLTLYQPGRLDAIVKARPLNYQDACDCWRYEGAAREIPNS